MATSTVNTNKPIIPRGADVRPIDSYNRAALYSGKALDFDGVNDSVSTGTQTAFDMKSIAFYFIGAIDSSVNGFVMHPNDAEYNKGVMIGQFTSTLTNECLSIGDGTNHTTIKETFDDGIHFAVFSWDATNSKYKIFVNGVELITENNGTDSSLISGITSPIFGKRAPLNDFYLDGSLSNIRLFDVALTAAQIADLYNNPEKVVPTGVANTALKLWLPMMEGAGTTAYDGSGNGNHGTISGATYVNGVGAPVAQTSVIDWNKGVNELPESNGFVEADLNFAYQNSSETEATITAPDGSTDAFEYICDAVTTNNQFFRINPNATYTSGQVYTYSLFVKYNTKQFVKLAYMNYAGSGTFAAAFDLVNGVVTDEYTQGGATNGSSFIEEAPNGWYRIGISAALPNSAGQAMNFEFNVIQSGTPTWSTYGRVNQTTTTSDKVYIYGASLIEGAKGVYVHTIGTTQPTPVLLPQGLTTGRDITGVNLFESVRKQGALNLDGSSYAEVYENASIDLSDCSLEAWVCPLPESGSTWQTIFSKVSQSNLQIYLSAIDILSHYNSASAGGALDNTAFNKNEWNHFVCVEDGSDVLTYVNGVLQSTKTISLQMDNDGIFFIGANNTSGADAINAQIAQPRIYNRALTAEEVLKNYNATSSLYI